MLDAIKRQNMDTVYGLIQTVTKQIPNNAADWVNQTGSQTVN